MDGGCLDQRGDAVPSARVGATRAAARTFDHRPHPRAPWPGGATTAAEGPFRISWNGGPAGRRMVPPATRLARMLPARTFRSGVGSLVWWAERFLWDGERPEWAWVPLKSVGPIRFGQSKEEVSAALGEPITAWDAKKYARWYPFDGACCPDAAPSLQWPTGRKTN
jgi:hypothetical protein